MNPWTWWFSLIFVLASSFAVQDNIENETVKYSEILFDEVQAPLISNQTLPGINQRALNEITVWDKTMVEFGEWMKKGLIGNMMGNVFKTLHEANTSASCRQSMIAFEDGLNAWATWAMYMADSSSKLPSGLLDGTLMDFGNFEQCLKIRTDTFQGQYCLIGHSSPLVSNIKRELLGPYIKQYGMPPDWIKTYLDTQFGLHINETLWLSACLPSTCSEEDARNMFTAASKGRGLNVQTMNCQTDEPKELSSIGMIALKILCFILSLSVFGTLWDVWLSPEPADKNELMNQSAVSHALRAFSVRRRVWMFMQESMWNSRLGSLHGLRLIGCYIVVFAHVYVYPDNHHHARLSHLSKVDCLMNDTQKLIFDNLVIVLTNFFFASGVLFVYTSWRRMERNGGRINFIRFFLHRIMRIYPSFLLMVALFFIVPVMSRGPIWNTSWQYFTENCEKRIWYNLLFVSNYYRIDEMCIPHTWFLPVLMQCQIVGVIVLFITFRWRKTGVALAFSIIAAASAWGMYLSYHNSLPLPSLLQMNDLEMGKNFAKIMYTKLHCHIGSFIIGMWCGYLILKYKDYEWTQGQKTIGWIMSVVFLFGSYVCIRLIEEYGILSAIYNGLYRTVFSLGLLWIIYACVSGFGGIVNTVMTWRPFVFLSNLSFMTYLLHPVFYAYKAASTKERTYLSHIEMLFEFLGIIVYTLMASCVGHILIEAPFNELGYMLIGSEIATTKPLPTVQVETTDVKKSE